MGTNLLLCRSVGKKDESYGIHTQEVLMRRAFPASVQSWTRRSVVFLASPSPCFRAHRSCDGFESVFLPEACQGWLSLLLWPARPPAASTCVIPVPPGSRLPQWVVRERLVPLLYPEPRGWLPLTASPCPGPLAPLWGLWQGEWLSAWFGVDTKRRRGQIQGAGTYRSCWGPSHQ